MERRWGADDDGDVMAGGGADGVVEPVEIVVAFRGFEGGPGELGDADEADVRGLHEREVGVPAPWILIGGPLLGVPGGAEVERGRRGGRGVWLRGGGRGLRRRLRGR